MKKPLNKILLLLLCILLCLTAAGCAPDDKAPASQAGASSGAGSGAAASAAGSSSDSGSSTATAPATSSSGSDEPEPGAPSHGEDGPHRWDGGVCTREPDCETPGTMTFTCAECGATRTEALPALGHDWSPWQDEGDGNHTRTCSRDKSHKETQPHRWDEGTVTLEPTCTEPGCVTYACPDCGAELAGELAPLGHDFSDWLPGEGEHYRVCQRDDSHRETEPHTWDAGVVAAEELDYAAALERYSCPVCGGTRWLRAFHIDESTNTFYISSWNGGNGGESVRLRVNYSEAPDRQVRYQWYVCADENGKNPVPVAGADGPELYTGILETPGAYSWFCEITYPAPPEGTERTYRTPLYRVAYTGLPTVRIDTKNGAPVESRDVNVSGTLTLAPGPAYPCTPLSGEAMTIKGRGNSTWFMPKKGYNVKFSQKLDLFGLGKDKKWSLVANYADKSLLRNWLAGELTKRVFVSDIWQPGYVPVDLVLNGEYLGSYVLVTSIKISGSRVDVPDIAARLEEDVNGDGVVDLWDGGFILEVEERMDATWNFRTTQGVAFTLKDPDMDSGAEGEYSAQEIVNHIQSYIQTVEDALFSEDFLDPETGYRRYLDVDSVVDWYLVNELTKNNDAIFFSSVYMVYDPADGLLHMGPNWDFDISCGNINYNENDDPTGLWIRYSKWMDRLLQDPDFVSRVQQRWQTCLPALRDVVENVLPRQAALLTPSARMNFARWQILGTWVWPNANGWDKRTTYESEVEYLTEWLTRRIEWLDGVFGSEE